MSRMHMYMGRMLDSGIKLAVVFLVFFLDITC